MVGRGERGGWDEGPEGEKAEESEAGMNRGDDTAAGMPGTTGMTGMAGKRGME